MYLISYILKSLFLHKYMSYPSKSLDPNYNLLHNLLVSTIFLMVRIVLAFNAILLK